MAELTDRELRQISFCSKLSAALKAKTFIAIPYHDIFQILDDLRNIARERNQLEDEVLVLSSLVLGEYREDPQ